MKKQRAATQKDESTLVVCLNDSLLNEQERRNKSPLAKGRISLSSGDRAGEAEESLRTRGGFAAAGVNRGRKRMPSPHEVTRLLQDCSGGDPAALDKLMPLVQAELHRLAHHYMSRERADHTLQTTALINEAYLRLVRQDISWHSRAHFFGIAARLMRPILVDYARKRHYAKRAVMLAVSLWTRR